MTLRSTHFRSTFFLALAVSVCLVGSAAEKPVLKPLKAKPDGLSKKIAATLDPAGYRIDGPDGAVVEFWVVKDVGVNAAFKPTLNVKYPFTPGQLIGAMRIPEKSQFTDFRGQNIAAGVYTIRYGQQPEDGNHIGTSETADFLMAIPAKVDTDPKPVSGPDQLAESSAKSVQSTHPAIFSLLPVEKPADKPTLTHDEDNEFWIVSLTVDAKAKNKSVKLPLRFVVFGHALE
jgi:hypothetical protein